MKVPLKSNTTFKSTAKLKELIKPASKISSFLLFDGQTEVSLAEAGHFVISHTNKPFIYEFWVNLLTEPKVLAQTADALFPTLAPAQLTYLQESWTEFKYPIDRSALFFLLNRCSDSGFVSCGKINKDHYNPIALSYVKNFKIKNFYPYLDQVDDPFEAIASAKDADYILLPVGNYSFNFFEQGKSKGPEMYSINHKKLFRTLQQINKKWIILYKFHPALLTMYNRNRIFMFDAYGKPTKDKAKCEELAIVNF